MLQKYGQSGPLKLDISGNPLSDRGIFLLAETIAERPIVSHLNISGLSGVTGEGLEAFLSIIKHNKSLSDLDMRCNNIRRRFYEKAL